MSVIVPVILNGGTGARLWPLSRRNQPKQFLKLLGGRTLFQATILRALETSGVSASQIVTVTLGRLKKKTIEELSALDQSLAMHVLGEPEARNTAGAFLFAAHYVRRHWGKDALMWVLPSDHNVGDIQALKEALRIALPLAAKGFLVTFGINPTRPETGYGYIHAGESLPEEQTRRVKSFFEKPPKKLAEELYESGEYLWSSGVHLFNAGSLIDNFIAYAPETAALMTQALSSSADGKMPSMELYATLKKEPYEKAVLEKAAEQGENVAVVPCDPRWSDIGSWQSLWEIREKDPEGNAVEGRVLCKNTQNCFIHSSTDRLIACIGLRDLVIADMGDVVMIADKNDNEGIRTVAETLEQARMKEGIALSDEEFQWGGVKTISEARGFKLREVLIKPGQRRNFRMHRHRTEFWVIASGEALVALNGQTQTLVAQDSVSVPPGMVHEIQNPGVLDLRIFEFQYGDHLDENDTLQFEDPYGQELAA
ncbi:MAG: mannose-1-phosphate guanylyltransferase/mannose-6-phosphate isomerase [Alphaproteobacteria bacterium]|nr:mannose-1-phosphate guanylyltransferase/mannose-6-phosphate isomerase [Alphaproteobacteria bacterium]